MIGWQVHAETNRVEFPDLDELVHYTTVRRGDVMEHIMTTPAAMEAVKNGQPIPAPMRSASGKNLPVGKRINAVRGEARRRRPTTERSESKVPSIILCVQNRGAHR
ncbi:MAG: hypothetical protein AB7I34_18255 [Rhizobiaceae bacterium]